MLEHSKRNKWLTKVFLFNTYCFGLVLLKCFIPDLCVTDGHVPASEQRSSELEKKKLQLSLGLAVVSGCGLAFSATRSRIINIDFANAALWQVRSLQQVWQKADQKATRGRAAALCNGLKSIGGGLSVHRSMGLCVVPQGEGSSAPVG